MRLKPSAYLMLGMLRAGVGTGYAIKRAVDQSTRFFWSTSFAQVYPELAHLEADTHLHIHLENNLLFPAVTTAVAARAR